MFANFKQTLNSLNRRGEKTQSGWRFDRQYFCRGLHKIIYFQENQKLKKKKSTSWFHLAGDATCASQTKFYIYKLGVWLTLEKASIIL